MSRMIAVGQPPTVTCMIAVSPVQLFCNQLLRNLQLPGELAQDNIWASHYKEGQEVGGGAERRSVREKERVRAGMSRREPDSITSGRKQDAGAERRSVREKERVRAGMSRREPDSITSGRKTRGAERRSVREKERVRAGMSRREPDSITSGRKQDAGAERRSVREKERVRAGISRREPDSITSGRKQDAGAERRSVREKERVRAGMSRREPDSITSGRKFHGPLLLISFSVHEIFTFPTSTKLLSFPQHNALVVLHAQDCVSIRGGEARIELDGAELCLWILNKRTVQSMEL
ncbi:hypothetical protein J6590_004199 [Homalodisca vitripennis]|nr:hypothetical protein J6590_004199 [Homalodisca vitripennis]